MVSHRGIVHQASLAAPPSADIMNRSLVIHDSKGSRWTCANIAPTTEPMPVLQMGTPPTPAPGAAGKRFTAVFQGSAASGLGGSIDFYQPSPTAPTQVVVNFRGASRGATTTNSDAKQFGSYHVHVNPIDPANPSGPCSPQSVGGHFNPFNIVDYTQCDPQTPTTCEVGDLSGKFGYLTGTNYAASYSDSFLPLSGEYRACPSPIALCSPRRRSLPVLGHALFA